MTNLSQLSWLLVALPSAGALTLLLLGRRSDRWGHLLACVTVIGSFVIGLVLLAQMLGHNGSDRAIHTHLFRWVPVGALQVDFGMLIDQLSICFVLLISGVGSLIHIYSTGYMKHDPDRRRFFAYLNLFVAAMLLLVVADSYLGLYVGWEGVGLASYLLIGFWYARPAAAAAGKKAFVSNRVGDIGLSLAMFAMFAGFGTVSYDGLFGAVAEAGPSRLTTTIGLLLLIGACAKSAQVPLQAWLFDAMEGPTPVSALIHAATMVTAGVYLIVRSGPVFDLSPDARMAVVVVGAVTLLFGAIIGCANDDIKRALAASTVSQIGYMVLAAGLGPAGYAVAIMHLLTHGFFKAGLFLGSGSVMHAMNDEQDMRRYGALRGFMPVTFVTFGLCYLAIIGVPPFAGYWSKDAIIEAALASGGTRGWVLGAITIAGAGITAFYMTRVMLMTFAGERRWAADSSEVSEQRALQHPHESPPVMTWPMVILACGAVFAGAALAVGRRLENWLEPVVSPLSTVAEQQGPHVVPAWMTGAITLGIVMIGVAVAYVLYGRKPVPIIAPTDVSPLTVAARHYLYGDDFNEEVLMRPGNRLAQALVTVDDRVVDGSVAGAAGLVAAASQLVRRLQTGFVRSYALTMLAGTVLVIVVVMAVQR